MALPLIPRYSLIEPLGSSLNASVYKACLKEQPDNLYVIKILKRPIKSIAQQNHLKQRIKRLKIINDSRVILPKSIEYYNNTHFISRQYLSGKSLGAFFLDNDKHISLTTFLHIATELSLAISSVHEAGIIHGSIKPHNILIHPKTESVQIFDLLNPISIQEISNFIYDQDFVENTLAFTSPEQTGRINRRIEFSTDIYSLGIVFYQLLTGELPFTSTDPLKLIHSHLAEEALPVHKVNQNIPVMVSNIIAKMCQKEPEKRYQTSMGLYADIRLCRDAFEETREIQPFALGLNDQTRRIVFISKMMGRATESKIITEEYSKVVTGNGFNAIFISGLPGIGKTRLIQELQQPLIANKGYFTAGKFDQYQKNIPYSSLIDALRNQIRTLLTESDERVKEHKKAILKALGKQSKVISNVIPELSHIIGEQPDIDELPPVEARNRFNNLLGAFLSSLCSEKNSLILFVDDLQWCDSASFDFLEYIFVNSADYPYLFFIGAYRDNEVSATHPLSKLLEKFRVNNSDIKELSIGPLSADASHEMVAYILDLPRKQTGQLSKFLSELSEGNPLFVSESLSWLHNESLLIFSEQGQWIWDMRNIAKSNMPTSVVEMFVTKVHQLKPTNLDVVKICACMGNRFSAEDIALIYSVELTELFNLLKPLFTLGLLIESKTKFQFVHDRVQEAVLGLIPDNIRREIHWKVAWHLLGSIEINKELEKQEYLFTIAAHLNLGLPNSIRKDDIVAIAKINLYAGNKALKALATQAANEYFRQGINLLSEEHWKTDYQLIFRLYQKLAKTELMGGHYDESVTLIDELLYRAIDDIDRAEALAEQTTSLSSIGNFIQAIATANKGLGYFNEQIPEQDELATQHLQNLLNTITNNYDDVWQDILNMPFTEERKSKIELIFYSELIPDLYMSGMVPQLYLSAAQSTMLCLNGGMDESVIYSFSIMGLYYGSNGQFDIAFRYEDLAHELCTRYPDTFGSTRGINGIVWCNMHSRSHPQEIINYCHKGIQGGKNCGDLYNAGLSYGPLMWNMQVQGTDFDLIVSTAKACLEFSQKNQLQFSIGLAEAVQAGWILPMLGQSKNNFSIDEKLLDWKENNYVAAAGSYYVLLGMSHYYFARYQEAHNSLEQVNEYLTGMTDNVLKRQWYVFKILTALKRYKNSEVSKTELKNKTLPLLERVRIWENLGPLLKPYLALCEAEWNSIFSSVAEANQYFLEAIESAKKQSYTFLVGYINEAFAGWLLENNWLSYQQYLKSSMDNYRQCGCSGKIQHFQELYSDQINVDLSAHGRSNDAEQSDSKLPDLDVDYLIKWSLALSAETDVNSLMSKISSLLLECSGAQEGYFLQKVGGDWFVYSECHVDKISSTIQEPKIVRNVSNICQGIVNYVIRTGEKVVLHDALLSDEFKHLPEVADYSIRSLLCIPILSQTKLIGVIYLENRLSAGIFTASVIRLIELLSLQMAISISNANLITEQSEQQYLLQRSQKMEALGKLTGGIAHDFNNMLAVVLGYAGLLKAALKDEPKLERYAESIQHAGEHSANLTKKLLDFSRHKISIKKSVNINDLIESINNMLAKTLTARIDLDIKLLSELWLVLADEGDLEDAILNICINAMQSIDGTGQITISTSNKVLSEIDAKLLHREPGDYVLMTISDTGCGMDDFTKENIFDPFYSTKGEQGTGLGLSQVYGFMERANGAIHVYSELNIGTQFDLYFPRYISEGSAIEESSEAEAIDLCGNETILVVDDEIALLNLTNEILTIKGYKVYCAENAKKALEYLEEKSIDLMLSDIIMPEMDGIELMSIVQRNFPSVKIQLASGFTDNRNIETLKGRYRGELLHKPFSSSELLKKIREVLNSDF